MAVLAGLDSLADDTVREVLDSLSEDGRSLCAVYGVNRRLRRLAHEAAIAFNKRMAKKAEGFLVKRFCGCDADDPFLDVLCRAAQEQRTVRKAVRVPITKVLETVVPPSSAKNVGHHEDLGTLCAHKVCFSGSACFKHVATSRFTSSSRIDVAVNAVTQGDAHRNTFTLGIRGNDGFLVQFPLLTARMFQGFHKPGDALDVRRFHGDIHSLFKAFDDNPSRNYGARAFRELAPEEVRKLCDKDGFVTVEICLQLNPRMELDE